jgi:hypothetical protein
LIFAIRGAQPFARPREWCVYPLLCPLRPRLTALAKGKSDQERFIKCSDVAHSNTTLASRVQSITAFYLLYRHSLHSPPRRVSSLPGLPHLLAAEFARKQADKQLQRKRRRGIPFTSVLWKPPWIGSHKISSSPLPPCVLNHQAIILRRADRDLAYRQL